MNPVKLWKCEVCGHIHEGQEQADTCPVCGVSKELFQPFEIAQTVETGAQAEKWRCTICDYSHEGAKPPQVCPVCGASSRLFEESPPEDDATEQTTDVGPIVIIGAGIAGVTAAEHARVQAPTSEIIVVSDEPQEPYYRLNLTRLLAGEVERSEMTLKPQSWFDEQRIHLKKGEVASIQVESKTVRLKNDETFQYQTLVLANGSHAFVPPIRGVKREGVHVLRNIKDAEQILSRVREDCHCVCIGGGLLGLEAGGALKRRGANVTIVEGYGWLLPRQLPERGSRILEKQIYKTGIQIEHNANVEEILGDEAPRSVVLRSGREIEAELVIISTGVRPNSYLARQAGIKVAGGVVVDSRMRTSNPSIYAAGDVAEYRGATHGIWPVAYAQGAIAGANAAGGHVEYKEVPRSNRLKVMDVDMFSIGLFQTDDGSYDILEKEDGETYKRIVCRDEQIVGAVLYGDTEHAIGIKEAIESKQRIRELNSIMADFK
jgi:NAD(P)H-nitrite reductase large subunit/rubredoxin